MKIITVLLSFISCFALAPRAFGQGQNKIAKAGVISYGSEWVPRSVRQSRKGNSWAASPSAHIIPGKQNPAGKKAVENLVFKSTDGGQTWQDISEGLPETLQEGLFSNNTGLYLRAGDGIYHSKPNSTDPLWIKETCPNNYSGIAPAKRGMMAYNYGGLFFQKADGANGWSPMYTNFQEKLVRTVFETAGGSVFIGCDNGLFKSANNGKTWKQVRTAGWVTKLVESNGVLMATSQEGIIRSADGGENWDLVISEGGVGISVEVINGGFAAITFNTTSMTRRIRTSYDSGKNWELIDAGLPEEASIASIVSIVQDGDYLFCGHPMGIFRSSDKGKTWTLLLASIGGKVFNLYVSGNVIYAIPRDSGC